MTQSGRRAQPFWSTLSRVERIIKSVPAYSGFAPEEIPWEMFCLAWVPDLTRDGLLVGVNWSGKHAIGYDLEPERVRQNVEAVVANPQ
jgi:hypothetical protein